MPVFSYWTVGPTDEFSTSNWCFGNSKKLGISYFHTWINCGITIIGQFFFLVHESTLSDINGPPFWMGVHIFLIFILPFHAFSMIMLAFLQYFDYWKCCRRFCSKKSIIKRTLLNIDIPHETILLEEKEKKGCVANYCCIIILIIILAIIYIVHFRESILDNFWSYIRS